MLLNTVDSPYGGLNLQQDFVPYVKRQNLHPFLMSRCSLYRVLTIKRVDCI